MTAAIPPQHSACQNCGAPMLGEHCYACGQPTRGLVRHFGSILGDFVDSVFDLDGRLWRTLGPLLLRPGYLSNQYFAGHRVRYVSPVRLFVFFCILAFFVVQLSLDLDFEGEAERGIRQAETVAAAEQLRDQAVAELEAALAAADANPGARAGIEIGLEVVREEARERIAWLQARDAALAAGRPPPSSPAQMPLQFNGRPWHAKDNPIRVEALPEAVNGWLNAWAERAQDNVLRVRQQPRLLVEAFLHSLPQTLFLLLPVFAVLLKLGYLFKRRLYMEHLIVALHSHAFLCAALLLYLGCYQLGRWLPAGSAQAVVAAGGVAVLVWMPLYLWLTQKRVYRQGVLLTSVKFVALGLAYSALLSVGAAVNLMFSLVAL